MLGGIPAHPPFVHLGLEVGNVVGHVKPSSPRLFSSNQIAQVGALLVELGHVDADTLGSA